MYNTAHIPLNLFLVLWKTSLCIIISPSPLEEILVTIFSPIYSNLPKSIGLVSPIYRFPQFTCLNILILFLFLLFSLMAIASFALEKTFSDVMVIKYFIWIYAFGCYLKGSRYC